MSGWPEGWYRDGNAGRSGRPSRDPVGYRETGGGYSGGYSGGGYSGSGYSDPGGRVGAWPDQPPGRGPSRPYRGGGGTGPRSPRVPRNPRRIGRTIVTIVVIILVVAIAGYFYLNSRLTRVPAIADYTGRPVQGPGENYLITGDSGSGITPKQAGQLHVTNNPDKGPPDTWMILHMGSNGPVLISLPRDSYVPIPGFGHSKLNASYADGGPKLAVQTVETVTGLHIDHYMEIGYQNLVNVVNDVGGVNMCIKQPIHDSYSGVNLNAGCQTLNGKQALDYTRDRHSFATGDLQREQNQRALMKALLNKITSPTTLFNPFAMVPAAFGSSGSVSVDQGTQLYQLVQVAFAMRGPKTGTVPVANTALPTADGEAVEWDHSKASQLFNDMQNDQPIPGDLLSGTQGS
jgi:LCP family protein required for cell wall assembly